MKDTASIAASDRKDYERLKSEIVQSRDNWFRENIPRFIEIRERRLYLLEYNTFEAFCRDALGFSKQHTYELINASIVVKNLQSAEGVEHCEERNAEHNISGETKSAMADLVVQKKQSPILPATERQARPLTALKDPSKQRKAWDMAVRNSGGKQPTARQVEEAVKVVKVPITSSEAGGVRLEPSNKVKFNETNENIEWAAWSWNPYTGCNHDCTYCYARDIANRFYAEKFEPTFRPERLLAPKNTKVPDDAEFDVGRKNVFVCSMADLFGDWVKADHIQRILDVVASSQQWNFLFLTKNPKRYLEFNFSSNCWLGATADTADRAKVACEVLSNDRLRDITVRWLSCEPLLEDLCIRSSDDIKRIDWIVIGGKSRNTQEQESQPEWEWVEKILFTARRAGSMVYFKPNMTARPKEYPT